jgi:lysophospholipase L1-like esterase
LQNSAIQPIPVQSPDWINRHNAMVRVAEKGKSQLVFIGDSITHAFGGEPDTGESFCNRGKDTWDLYYGSDQPLNLGISGDRTQNVLWRLDHGAMGTCHPKVAVIMIGTNNVNSNTPQEIVAGVEAVCGRVKSLTPRTSILLLGIFPRDKADSPSRKAIAQINVDLAAWSSTHQVRFLDIGRVFIGPEGEISTEVMPDLLHPFAFGYRKWAMAMEPTLAKLMHRHPKTILDPSNSAVVPVTQNRDYRTYDWATRHQAVLSYAKEHVCRLAFLGDSINHFFGGPPLDRGLASPRPVWQAFYGKRDAVDIGFGWDRTENVLWRLEQGEIRDMPLEAVSIMIGTNNIDFNPPEQIRDGVQAIVDMVRTQKPKAKILLLGIFPRGEQPNDPKRLQVLQVNRLLAPIGEQKNVTFMDISARFLEPDGTISRSMMGDFLHPTDKGYRIWADTVEPWMKAHVRSNEPR